MAYGRAPAPRRHPATTEADVIIARVDSLPIAEMLAELLGKKGIAFRIVPKTSRTRPATMLEVRVAEGDAELADRFLSSIDGSGGGTAALSSSSVTSG